MNEDGIEYTEDGLRCPGCKSTWDMHHGAVTVRMREREDGVAEVFEIARGEANSHHQISSKELPGRRDSLDIKFHCGMCNGSSTLRILQHKGQTFMTWADFQEGQVG